MDLFSRKTVVAKDMAKAKRIRIKAQFWRRYSLNIWVFYIFIVQQYQEECRHMHAKKKRAPYGSANINRYLSAFSFLRLSLS